MKLLRILAQRIYRRLSPRFNAKHLGIETSKQQLQLEKQWIRSNADLEVRAQDLTTICQALDSLGISYYISGGALLGATRGGDFIAWDHDVDIDVKTEEIRGREKEVAQRLAAEGFVTSIHRLGSGFFNLNIHALKNETKFELLAYQKMGQSRYRAKSFYPELFYQGGSTISIRNRSFRTFAQPQQYVEWFYGEHWRTPLQGVQNYWTSFSRTNPILAVFARIRSFFP